MSTGSPGAGRMAGRPAYTVEEIETVVRETYGLDGRLRELPSDRDQNFLVQVDGSPHCVVKIANSAERLEVIELQQRAMEHLAAAGISGPVPIKALDGSITRRVDDHLFWVVSFLPGELLAARTRRSPGLLRSFGVFLATMTRAFAGFEHPAAHRVLPWDVGQSGKVIAQHLPEVDPDGRELVERALRAFETSVGPALPELPHSVIHNDANDHNVMVEDDGITGIIDFGDMLHSVTLNELAIGATYAALGQDDPWECLDQVASGYATTMPLGSDERALLPGLVRTRLATSIAMSSHQHALEPDNDYLLVSQEPAWRVLHIVDRALGH